MASLEKRVLGELRGKVGGIVAKVRYGKQYIASLPSGYRMSKAPHEVDKRNKFKVNGKFAGAIKESGLLYRVWEKEKAPAVHAWNKICKINFKLCEPERPSARNLITPGGFPLPVTNIRDFSDRIEIELGTFEILSEEKKITFIVIISFYEPEVKENPYFEIRRLTNYTYEDSKFVFKYSAAEEHLAVAYKHKTIFIAAVTEDEGGKISRWSNTFATELLEMPE